MLKLKRAPQSGAHWKLVMEGRLFDADTLITLVELGNLTTGVNQAVLTGVSRMSFRVDVETQRIARFAIGRTGLVLGAICHLDSNFMIIGMNIFLQRNSPAKESGL